MNQTALSIKTIKDLRNCYNTHAQKFSSTRKKNRPEMQYILEQIVNLSQELNKPLHILELGCGDGRLLRELKTQYPDTIASYTGVDISDQLLMLAEQGEKKSKKIHWIQDDMISYLSKQKSESIDIIITMASYQHLPDRISRDQFVKQVYRSLVYEGQRCSVDRSWSPWLIKKHYRPILRSLKQYVTKLGGREWNNLFIPFTDQGQTHRRLYHIQTIREIRTIIKQHGLQLKERSYSSQKGSFHHNVLHARNICFVAKKTIYSS